MSEDRRYRFIGIFETALELKATLAPTDQRYVFVVYPPGTPQVENPANLGFQSGSNSPYQKPSLSTSQGGSNSHKQRENLPSGTQKLETVQSWMYASLHVYPPVISSDRDSLLDALLKPNNFLTEGEPNQMRNVLHIKSIILRRSDLVRSITDRYNGGPSFVETEPERRSSLQDEIINRAPGDTWNRPSVRPSDLPQSVTLEKSRGLPLSRSGEAGDGSNQHQLRFEQQVSESLTLDEDHTASSEGKWESQLLLHHSY